MIGKAVMSWISDGEWGCKCTLRIPQCWLHLLSPKVAVENREENGHWEAHKKTRNLSSSAPKQHIPSPQVLQGELIEEWGHFLDNNPVLSGMHLLPKHHRSPRMRATTASSLMWPKQPARRLACYDCSVNVCHFVVIVRAPRFLQN